MRGPPGVVVVQLAGGEVGGDLLVLKWATLALADRGRERSQSDLGRTEVGDLVNLERGVNVVLGFENLLNLVGRDGVKASAEGDELD